MKVRNSSNGSSSSHTKDTAETEEASESSFFDEMNASFPSATRRASLPVRSVNEPKTPTPRRTTAGHLRASTGSSSSGSGLVAKRASVFGAESFSFLGSNSEHTPRSSASGLTPPVGRTTRRASTGYPTMDATLLSPHGNMTPNSIARRRVSAKVDSRLKELTAGLSHTFVTGEDDEDDPLELLKSPATRRKSSADFLNRQKNFNGSFSNNLNDSAVLRPSQLPVLVESTMDTSCQSASDAMAEAVAAVAAVVMVLSEEEDEEEEPEVLEPPKLTTLTAKPTGTAHDFVSGRTDATFEDHYDLGDLLGEGAFGAVYKCFSKNTPVPQERAVKIIDKDQMQMDYGMPEEMYAEVMHEFQLLTDLKDNDNVIRVYEFYDAAEKFYIVQELAAGGELFDKLEEEGRMKEDDVREIMRCILACVDYLEQNKIVHRDINLENILLGDGLVQDAKGNKNYHQRIKLIDFGLATKCDAGDRLTEMVGKPRYIAPEVLGSNGYGLAYDVWSCGVTAYTLLVGFMPFEADNDFEVYGQIVDGFVPFDDPEWKDVSEQAIDLVKLLLTYDENKRPTPQQALEHEWFTAGDNHKNNGPAPSSSTVSAAAAASVAARMNPAQMIWSAATTKPAAKAKACWQAPAPTKKDIAARVLQRFFRRATHPLRVYRQNSMLLQEELKASKIRQQEELERLQLYIELEKQKVRVDLLHEDLESLRFENKMAVQAMKKHTHHLSRVMRKHEAWKKSVAALTMERKRLDTKDPWQTHKVINDRITFYGKDNAAHKETLDSVQRAMREVEQELEQIQEQISIEQASRKKVQNCVTKVKAMNCC